MKFFIDTANLDQIKEAQDMGILDGVTTNPSLMAKEGITGHDNILKHYVDICNIVDGDVSAEVISTDFEGMVKEGEALAELHDQIVIKLPMIKDGVKACIGALVFELIRTYAFEYAPQIWQFILGGSLLVIIMFLPDGIWSLKSRLRTLQGSKSS